MTITKNLNVILECELIHRSASSTIENKEKNHIDWDTAAKQHGRVPLHGQHSETTITWEPQGKLAGLDSSKLTIDMVNIYFLGSLCSPCSFHVLFHYFHQCRFELINCSYVMLGI